MKQIYLDILEELLNEEIREYLRSGYGLDDEYVIAMREMLKYFNLKEIWGYDKIYGSDKE